MNEFNSIWLFKFTSYSYCQGTKDTFYCDLRLLKFTLPCSEWEARTYLISTLSSEGIDFDLSSIKSLNINITNS